MASLLDETPYSKWKPEKIGSGVNAVITIFGDFRLKNGGGGS
jgi:hypothetical protein